MGEIVYLSLGSNLGDREKFLHRATRQISEMVGITIIAESPLYHSRPLECAPDTPDFLNKILKIQCNLKPPQLLDNTERLEQALGRTAKGFNVDRVIDIDIILFGNRMFKNERLEIPHPRMHRRAFVLIPLLEIDPDLADPKTGKRYSSMLSEIGNQGVKILKETVGD